MLDAAETAAKRGAVAQPDTCVSVAFTLGWQMAEVYRPDRRAVTPVSELDLPGISRLTDAELAEMRLAQLQAGIAKLWRPIADAGLWAPDAQAFSDRMRDPDPDPADRDQAIRAFHVALLSTLTAADFRLGTAYGLGRALADTTRDPGDPRAELGQPRVATLTTWIRELTTAFPPHAAHPVAESLQAWGRWATTAGPGDADAVTRLRVQGRLWHSLLSGEKRAIDTLETSDYLRAGEGMLQRTGALAGRSLKRYWWIIVIALALFAVGAGLIEGSSNGVAVGTGAATLLAGAGLSWKGIGTSLGTAAARIEQPLWEAELDTVIYRRITAAQVLSAEHQRDRKGPP
ncbi:MAG: hypothetical protein ACR2NR_02755 [Solirubrobacteraceae bacterium]